MESLLLGALAYYGKEGFNINNKKDIKNNYDNFYNSNIEDKMNNIEKKNASNLKSNPDYFQQFDSLSFDNISKPTAENQSYFTNSGLNTFLQRDIEFKNGYSEFQNSDMHYNVVTKENFMHNNMVPNTSRRDTFIDTNTRKYESLSGNNIHWNHKKEVERFFEPVSNLTNPTGMPVVAGALANRYIPSNKNNYGNLPFKSDIKVVKGIDNRKQAAPYSVYRLTPRNIDALRSETNKKVSFINKPLETIKKGDRRGPDFNLTKYKLPSYRETTTEDLISNNSANKKMKMNGQYVHLDSQRGQDDTFRSGNTVYSNKGNTIDKSAIKFTESKKENFENDFTHSINAVNSRPVFQNQESFTPYENQRDTTSTEVHSSGVYHNNASSYHIDRNNEAKSTMKQHNIEGNRHLGANGNYEKKTYLFSKDSILPVTHRESTSQHIVLNPTPTHQNINNQLSDKARPTIKQSTVEASIISNVAPTYKNINNQLSDKARTTIKQSTVESSIISNIAPSHQNINNQLTDKAKPTIKQSTIHNEFAGNVAPTFKNINNQLTDTAKPTIKQFTIHNEFAGNVAPTFKNINNQLTDNAKPTIKQFTIHNEYAGNVAPTYKNINNVISTPARPTIKESTVDHEIVGTLVSHFKDMKNYLTDQAKPTIKETTENNEIIGNVAPSFQNIINQLNDEARPTIKQTTENNEFVGNVAPSFQNIINQLNDEAKPTIKQSTIHNEFVGNVAPSFQNINNQLNDEAKPTIKQSTIHNEFVGNVAPSFQNINNQLNDHAKPTIKETTINNEFIGNLAPSFQNINNQLNDQAKSTIKETTINNDYIGIRSGDNNKETYINNNDNAKITIKETTLFNMPAKNAQSIVSDTYNKNNDIAKTTIKETTLNSTPSGRALDSNQSIYVKNYDDEARVTIKETSLITDHYGGAGYYINLPKSEQAERNMCSSDKKEIVAMTNYTPNAKSDQIRGNINKNTVKYNNKRTTYEYISTPGKSLNYTVKPMDNIYINNKNDLNGNNYYKIDPIFITTMHDNPLVNDLVHQKNINFD
jgi:hypothetical protein